LTLGISGWTRRCRTNKEIRMNETTPTRRRPQPWIFALAGAGIFLAGLLIGSLTSNGGVFAFAAGSTSNKAAAQQASAQATKTPIVSPADAARYCAIYEHQVEQDTGLSASQLETANYDGLVAVLDQMVTDHKITAQQEAQIKAQLAQIKSAPCQNLTNLGKGAGPTAAQQQALASARSAIVAAVAHALNLTPDALQSDLKSGQTIPAIASAQHVALDSVNSAYLSAVGDQLKAAVSSGQVTQAQSDQLSTMIQAAVAAGHYPLLESGIPSA
jgi:hypothetical protein